MVLANFMRQSSKVAANNKAAAARHYKVTKRQKKRLNAFDLCSSLLMLSWYIVANGLLYDSTFLLQLFLEGSAAEL